jgi:putative drug exporter of the RND superfamily
MFEALGAFVFRFRWAVLVASAAFLAGAILVLLRGGILTTGDIHGLESESAQQRIDEITGRPADTTIVAVFHALPGRPLSADELDEAIDAAVEPLRDDPRVDTIITPASLPPPMNASLIDAQGGTALVLITLHGDLMQALATYSAVRDRMRSDRVAIDCTGRVPFTHDLDWTLEHDLLRAELISVPLALLVLLVVFRTAVAAALPVGVGGLAVVGGIAVVLTLSRHTDIAQFTINMCSLIGLGVAIDYSLFLVSRYREELAAGLDHRAALLRSMDTAGRVVAFSGVAVVTGLSGLLFFDGSYLRAMGIGGLIVVALAVTFALTFLPALLAALGDRVHAGKLPFRAPRSESRLWHRMAVAVMRRPFLFLVPTLGVLLVMGAPVFRMRFAAADPRVLTGATEARRAFDLVKAHFPGQAEGRIRLVVRFPSAPTMSPPRAAALGQLVRRIEGIPHVTKVVTPEQDATLPVGAYALEIDVLSDALPEGDDARAIVLAIRSERAVADGTLLVGGEAAKNLDATDYVLSRAPKAALLVVGATLVVVFLLLGSVILPLKAVVMNFVSIAGSFGALVWVFQDGHLFVSEPRPVEPSLPVVLFCVLFGLSMDYEVLMLSRMKEAYERSGDNTDAVAEGLERSAGLITSAAAIMVSVFGAFALAHVVILQAVGLGMALAVALDATLIRVLLVPATMRLFGHLNWWAPAPVNRLRRALGLDQAH